MGLAGGPMCGTADCSSAGFSFFSLASDRCSEPDTQPRTFGMEGAPFWQTPSEGFLPYRPKGGPSRDEIASKTRCSYC